MTTTQAKTRTITLTDRPPVRISESAWPVIARSRDHDGEVEVQANRRYYLTVRKHADGRTIVYGSYTSQFAHEPDLSAGELLDEGADVARAIRRVGERVTCASAMIDDCIADLPAEDLS